MRTAACLPCATARASDSIAPRSKPKAGRLCASGLASTALVISAGDMLDQTARKIAAGANSHSATYQP
jgi:hypothetical protein